MIYQTTTKKISIPTLMHPIYWGAALEPEPVIIHIAGPFDIFIDWYVPI
jgi:hypothetical protein